MLEFEAVNTLYRRGRIIDPGVGTDMTADILVLEGRIIDIGPEIDLGMDLQNTVKEVDLRGLWVTPGWVDRKSVV